MTRSRGIFTLLGAVFLLIPCTTPAEAQTGTLLERVRARSAEASAQTAREPVGYLSRNPYLPGSTSSPMSRYDYRSPSNPYGPYGSPYARGGARNPYTTGGLDVVSADGRYLGRLNANPYDPESVSNPYGRYGSRYSPESINNPYGRYGSPYSATSATNPYATAPPSLLAPRTTLPGLPNPYRP